MGVDFAMARTSAPKTPPIAYEHTPKAWVLLLPSEPTADEAAWLGSFYQNDSESLHRKGFLTDTKTEGEISVPFRINIFRKKDGMQSTEKWMFGVVINPKPYDPKLTAQENNHDQHYFDKEYDNPFLAILAARVELERGGFRISDEPNLIGSLRMAFRQAIRKPPELP